MPAPIDRFVDERATRWERLATLVRRGRRDVRALASEEVLELGRLYRAASSDLAIAQRDYPGDRATFALNGLVSEAHALVYSEPQVPWRASSRRRRRPASPAGCSRSPPDTASWSSR